LFKNKNKGEMNKSLLIKKQRLPAKAQWYLFTLCFTKNIKLWNNIK